MIDGILHDNNSIRESFDNRTRSSSTCMSKSSQSNYTFEGAKSRENLDKKEFVFFEEAMLKSKIKVIKLKQIEILTNLDHILLRLKKWLFNLNYMKFWVGLSYQKRILKANLIDFQHFYFIHLEIILIAW